MNSHGVSAPSSPCCPGSTTTSPGRSPRRATGSVGCSPKSTPRSERVLGPRLDHPAVLDLLETWPTPAALTTAGKTRVRTRLLKKAPRLGGRLTEEIFAALAAQTVVVTGTNAAGPVAAALEPPEGKPADQDQHHNPPNQRRSPKRALPASCQDQQPASRRSPGRARPGRSAGRGRGVRRVAGRHRRRSPAQRPGTCRAGNAP